MCFEKVGEAAGGGLNRWKMEREMAGFGLGTEPMGMTIEAGAAMLLCCLAAPRLA